MKIKNRLSSAGYADVKTVLEVSYLAFSVFSACSPFAP